MTANSFIEVYTGYASDDYCDRMIAAHKQLEESCSASLCFKGEDQNGGVLYRKDVGFFFNMDAMDLAAETNSILNKTLAKYLLKYPSLDMVSIYSNTVKVQRTAPKGGFHLWHCEASPDAGASLRALVWMIYLNDTPEGEGTTEFLEQGIKLQPKKGNVVLFPADWTHTHRGNPVYTHDKYIATGWYYRNS